MKRYSRKHPEFSLCGLNCVLCPQFQTKASSKCPGCGGKQFHEKHPACSIITCSQKHGGIEFCHECAEFPCKKYDVPMKRDSFISKKNFMENMDEAKRDILKYADVLREKRKILEYLIENYNDGRMKSYFCIAVNLFPVSDLKDVIDDIHKSDSYTVGIKEKAKSAKSVFEKKAEILGIEVKLRK